MQHGEAVNTTPQKTAVYASTAALLLTAYVCSYFLISKGGRYEPVVVGARNVKMWQWEPRGFSGYGGRKPISWQLCYYPLWLMTNWLWHTSAKALRPGYPIRIWDKTVTPPGWKIVNP